MRDKVDLRAEFGERERECEVDIGKDGNMREESGGGMRRERKREMDMEDENYGGWEE